MTMNGNQGQKIRQHSGNDGSGENDSGSDDGSGTQPGMGLKSGAGFVPLITAASSVVCVLMLGLIFWRLGGIERSARVQEFDSVFQSVERNREKQKQNVELWKGTTDPEDINRRDDLVKRQEAEMEKLIKILQQSRERLPQ